MPINALPKDTPRGRGPEPSRSLTLQEQPEGEEEKSKEIDLAAQETQDLWESQEIGISPWSEQGSQRYSDPD
jgi:hypothetical protein